MNFDDSLTDEATYKRLYFAVLIQAIIDATSNPQKPQEILDKDRARAWILANAGTTAQAFEEICTHADIEPDLIRNFLRTYDGEPITMHRLAKLRNGLS